jgi:protein arginine kinase
VNLTQVIHNSAGWLRGGQDENGIVVSCRARLARNLTSAVFAHRAGDTDRARVVDQVLEATRHSVQLGRASYLAMEELGGNERRVLVERHLVSLALADGAGPRGVVFTGDESLSVMINEEDHLRLQAMVPGLQAAAAWERVSALDDDLGRGLDYAHHQRWGYLTACPTNAGTGLRVSALIHLPGLVLSDDMERVVRGLTQMSCSVRGFYGEGTNALGNLFQLSNQTTLGRSEEELVAELTQVTRHLIEFERDAQERLMKEAAAKVEDKVWRAYGLLCNARVLSSHEFMSLLSAVRLGRTLQLIDTVPSGFMNQLMIATQPAHLQAECGRELSAEERDVRRASLVRQRLGECGRACPNATGPA